MTDLLAEWFNPARITEDYVIPEFFVTRAGYIDMLPGPNLRYHMCFEHPSRRAGQSGKLEARVNFIMPLQSMLFQRGYVNAWIESKGLVVPKAGIIDPAKLKNGSNLN